MGTSPKGKQIELGVKLPHAVCRSLDCRPFGEEKPAAGMAEAIYVIIIAFMKTNRNLNATRSPNVNQPPYNLR